MSLAKQYRTRKGSTWGAAQSETAVASETAHSEIAQIETVVTQKSFSQKSPSKFNGLPFRNRRSNSIVARLGMVALTQKSFPQKSPSKFNGLPFRNRRSNSIVARLEMVVIQKLIALSEIVHSEIALSEIVHLSDSLEYAKQGL